jgi:hypothetical protein
MYESTRVRQPPPAFYFCLAEHASPPAVDPPPAARGCEVPNSRTPRPSLSRALIRSRNISGFPPPNLRSNSLSGQLLV